MPLTTLEIVALGSLAGAVFCFAKSCFAVSWDGVGFALCAALLGAFGAGTGAAALLQRFGA